MKVALVHDWLTGMRGGERCLEAFLELYPGADVFTLLHVPGSTSPEIDRRVKQVSWFGRLPGVHRYYRMLLPLYPLAARSLDLSGYDLVISLSHAAAKNVRIPKRAVHVCYCFTPMRYIWDQAQHYFGRATALLWPILSSLREWDVQGSERVTHFVAISRFVAARIRHFYGRRASVIHPPVSTSRFRPRADRGEAFLYAGALVPYKKADLVVRAFNELKIPLWVAGGGPEEQELRRIAGPNVTFFGRVSDGELAGLFSRCRALVFPGTEDFGIVPIEALASGRPVIARYAGALRESIRGVRCWREKASHITPDRCGVFFEDVNTNDKGSSREELDRLLDAIMFFIEHEDSFTQEACTRHAARFDKQRFLDEWRTFATSIGVPPGVERVTPQPVAVHA